MARAAYPRYTYTAKFLLTVLMGFLAYLSVGLVAKSYAQPHFILPDHRLSAVNLAIVANINDPLSLKIANYYQKKRGIPLANRIEVALPGSAKTMSPEQFDQVRKQIWSRTPPAVQAYVLTFIQPFRVGCMSVTSALAMGYDAKLCDKRQCRIANDSPYFNSATRRPFDEYGIRPAIMLTASSFAEAKALIDRGVTADGSWPTGTAYLLNTTDRHRNVRSAQFADVQRRLSPWFSIETIDSNAITNKHDVLFYFTGLARVAGLDTLTFPPGAIADHLTSFGGKLIGSHQMSSLRWLEAGATGSYGTVVEPCNYPMKFPMPGVVMGHYLRGETLIEAYWKSVKWPHEGVFIGEPLAAPFMGYKVTLNKSAMLLQTGGLPPGAYRLLSSESVLGPFRKEKFVLRVDTSETIRHRLPNLRARIYKLVPISGAYGS